MKILHTHLFTFNLEALLLLDNFLLLQPYTFLFIEIFIFNYFNF